MDQDRLPKAQKAQHPDKDTDSLGTNVFQSTDIGSLTIVSQPISKIHTLHIKFAEFATTRNTSQGQGQQGVFDITMAPILAFNAGNRCNVARAKCMHLAGEGNEGKEHNGDFE